MHIRVYLTVSVKLIQSWARVHIACTLHADLAYCLCPFILIASPESPKTHQSIRSPDFVKGSTVALSMGNSPCGQLHISPNFHPCKQPISLSECNTAPCAMPRYPIIMRRIRSICNWQQNIVSILPPTEIEKPIHEYSSPLLGGRATEQMKSFVYSCTSSFENGNQGADVNHHHHHHHLGFLNSLDSSSCSSATIVPSFA